MKARIPLSLVILSLLATPLPAASRSSGAGASRLSAGAASRLRSVEETSLADLRAGAPARAASIRVEERAALVQADEESRDLGALRAGNVDLSDHDIKVIAIVLAVVVVLVIIL